jgi:hypothetical protein
MLGPPERRGVGEVATGRRTKPVCHWLTIPQAFKGCDSWSIQESSIIRWRHIAWRPNARTLGKCSSDSLRSVL